MGERIVSPRSVNRTATQAALNDPGFIYSLNVKHDHKHRAPEGEKTLERLFGKGCHSKTIPRSRSGRYFGASTGMSMEEQFQRISAKVFWHVFLTSRAAWIIICMSSRLLRHSWA